MAIEEDVNDLMNTLSRLTTSEETSLVFKDKYKVVCMKNWKPWPDLPDFEFQKCFLVHATVDSVLQQNESSASHETNSVSASSKDGMSCGSIEYTGSPLEYMMDYPSMEKSFPGISEAQIQSIPISGARHICELHTMLPDSPLAKIPFFVACDGKDKQKTILLGISRDMRIIGFSYGLLVKDSDCLKFSDFKSLHLRGFPRPYPEMELSTYAYYDAFGSTSKSEVSALKPTTKGLMAIECKSGSFLRMLQKPPLDSTCCMLIQAILGDTNEGACHKYKELKFLQALQASLHTGDMVWNSENQPNLVLENLETYFNGLTSSHKEEPARNSSRDSTAFDSMFASYVMANREDMDFTDHLWSILIGCTSYKELCAASDFLFKELRNLPFVPYVCRKNNTTIAKLIRRMNDRPIMCPFLDGSGPIKLVMEMGIEKLCKDYVMLFVGLEMVPYDTLAPFLEICDDKNKAVEVLQKFHTILEMLISAWSKLHLPRLDLSAFARAAFKYYADVPTVDPCYIFKFPLSVCSIKDVLERAKPSIWQARIKSKSGDFEKVSVILFKKKASSGHQCVLSKHSTPYFLENPLYCVSSYRFIKDRLIFEW